jgi:hypothetical protein
MTYRRKLVFIHKVTDFKVIKKKFIDYCKASGTSPKEAGKTSVFSGKLSWLE